MRTILITLCIIAGNLFMTAQVSESSSGVVRFDMKKDEPKPSRKKIKDTRPPSILLTSPEPTRGAIVSTEQEILNVSGAVIDASEIVSAYINGKPAKLFNNTFSVDLPMNNDFNVITISATDIHNNRKDTSFVVNLQRIEKTSGRYVALLIAVSDYIDDGIEDLDQPLHDANALKKVLTDRYHFEAENVRVLQNPTRGDIFMALNELRRTITTNDHLLIFYAGHGLYDSDMKNGYWLPTDATRDNPMNWISNTDLTNAMSVINSKHTLLISDACFSGGIFKTRGVEMNEAAVGKLDQLRSRKAMTSGTLNEVPDQSVFIEYLVKNLEANDNSYLSAQELFMLLRPAVLNNSPNIPQYGTIQNVGDEGGDFIFKLNKP